MMRHIEHDGDNNIYRTQPAVAYCIIAMMLISPLGFIPTDILDLPMWFRLVCGVSLATIFWMGVVWPRAYKDWVFRKYQKMAREPDCYEITSHEWIGLLKSDLRGELITFRNAYIGTVRLVRFDDDHDRVMFVISRTK